MTGEGSGAERRAEREAMVARQLAGRGIEDERVLAAMRTVPREAFVPPERAGEAYGDHAVPLGAGQTISQPWIVAAISQALALRGGESVLEIGTGSGYSAAVLAALGADVVSIERIAELADLGRSNLERAGCGRVEVICGDGSVGLPDRAPFDAIAVHAAMPSEPEALLAQLGRAVASSRRSRPAAARRSSCAGRARRTAVSARSRSSAAASYR